MNRLRDVIRGRLVDQSVVLAIMVIGIMELIFIIELIMTRRCIVIAVGFAIYILAIHIRMLI